MLKKKWIVTSYLVLAIGLTACSNDTTNVDEKPPVEESNDVNQETTQPIEPTESTDTKEPDIKTEQRTDEEVTETPATTQESDKGKYDEIKLTATEAYDTFLQKKQGSKVEKVELDYDNNVYYYKIEGSDEASYYEMKIDAITGEIAKEEKDNKDDVDAEVSLDYVKKVDEFVKKSLDDAGGTLTSLEWDLEMENGRPELEIEIQRAEGEIEYTYDMETGELLEKDL